MPNGLEAAIVFALLIAPGFLMVRGYGHRRYRTVPERDIYAVAEAVVASAIWVALVWLLLLLFGDPVRDWGLIPLDTETLEEHRLQALVLTLAVIVLPYGVGAAFAAIVDSLERESTLFFGLGRRLGFLRNPTAWDRAWLAFDREGPGEVRVRLKDGSLVRGSWGRGAQADLSPSPTHHLLLAQGYLEEAGPSRSSVEPETATSADVVIRADGREGVFIQGEEISAVFFTRRREVDHGVRGAPAEPEGPAGG
jgi:Family of unknown function (DUF6338)